MFVKNFEKTKCINGCELFNDKSNYLYWENNKPTDDEIEIVNFLDKKIVRNSNILHIGVGSSYIAKNITFNQMIGVSISQNEIDLSKSLKLKNYNSFFLNKLSVNAFKKFFHIKFDYIIDVNLKSFSCCSVAFEKMFSIYCEMLNLNGCIISGKRGMSWSRKLKPVYRFSLKKLFYKKLKEFDGPDENKLTINDCKYLAKKNSLIFKEVSNSNIVLFIKN